MSKVIRVLIVDDSAACIRQGQTLLENADYQVAWLLVKDPQTLTLRSLTEDVEKVLNETDVLLIDKDLGQGITSTRFICVVRDRFPKLPIIRWTGGRNSTPYMQYLGVTHMEKPTKATETEFIETFNKALNAQRLILSGPMGIFDELELNVQVEDEGFISKEIRLRQIRQIAQLANTHLVHSDTGFWKITGGSGGVTKHELGHCICSGQLKAEDIRPYLSDLQKVIAKFEAAGEIDDRFRICAEFIKAGNLDELELVHRCY